MGYKLLGLVVWKSARWYVGRKYPKARPLALGALVAVAVAAVTASRSRGAE